MKKLLKRFLLLLLVFAAGVAGTAFLMNTETTDDRSDMNSPTLPEVMLDFDGTLANRMYGYRQPMETDFVRDCVTPLDTTKKLSLVVNPYDAEVTALSYEICTPDGAEIMENKRIKDLTVDGDYLRTDIEVASSLLMNQEYSLRITLETDVGEAYYYTRLVSRTATYTDSYVSFVNSFSRMCLDKNAADDLAVYLESTTSTTQNFSDITLESSLSNISWGDLAPQISRKGIPVIRDINETTASITLEYEISAVNDDGDTEYYNVTEFYRMRYTEERIRLLDFERSASQIFDPQLPVVSKNGLLLGVRNKNVDYMTDEEGTVVAFVQEGALWIYQPDSSKFVEVFNFRKSSDGDFRDGRKEHGIKLLSVTETGDVDFMVYGYMNRGTHEGYCGVGIYHYNSDQNVVDEKVFIPGTESYDFLKSDMGTLCYVNEEDQLFLLLSDKLYQVDIANGSYEIIEEGIVRDTFVVSETNAHAAWRIPDGSDAGRIKEISFDTGGTRTIAPEDGQELRTLGFMNEDLIYGTIQDGDILTDANGHDIEGISTIRIESFDGNVKKEYHQDGLYMTDVSISGTLMEFSLCAKTDSGYTVKKKDNIMNNSKAAAARLVTVEQTSSDRQGTMVRLAFEDQPDTSEPLIIHAKIRSSMEQVVALDTVRAAGQVYYVYARGDLDSTYSDPALAIQRADSRTGVVLDRAQQYVWERGNLKTQYTMNTEDIPEIIRSGSWDAAALQEGLGDTASVIDLTGCTLEEVLYEVSAQRAVVAKTGANSSTVIVGYDEYNTYLLDPATGEVSPYGLNDSTALFEAAGNVFLTYLETVVY